jgi:alcohol dehydrogenase
VGSGPIGLAALLTAQLYSPAEIVMIDVDDGRLEVATSLGATRTINSADGLAVDMLMGLTGGAGVDVAIEAVGVPETFDLCQSILAPGGRLANVGVHGRPVQLSLEKLWAHNVTITTRLVDTAATPMLLKLVQSGRLRPKTLVTHRSPLADVMKAYDTFGNAARERALKVVLHTT